MAPGDYKMYLSNNNSTQTSDNFYYNNEYIQYTNNYPIYEEEIIIKDKVKFQYRKEIGNCSKPKMVKKQYSRLVCRRG